MRLSGERLHDRIEELKDSNTALQRECANRSMRIADLERLIIRAADALEVFKSFQFRDLQPLIDELRKATE